MAEKNMPEMDDDARKDLLAMIAAGRELGPEMDHSLAESYMERHKRETASAQQPQAVMPQPIPGQPAVMWGWNRPNAVALAFVAVVFIAALLASNGWLWWLIFPLMGMAFGGRHAWGNWEYKQQRRALRNHSREQRRALRQGYHYEYHYDYHYGGPVNGQGNAQPPLPQAPTPMPAAVPAPQPPAATLPAAPVPAPVPQAPVTTSEPAQPPLNPAG